MACLCADAKSLSEKDKEAMRQNGKYGDKAFMLETKDRKWETGMWVIHAIMTTSLPTGRPPHPPRPSNYQVPLLLCQPRLLSPRGNVRPFRAVMLHSLPGPDICRERGVRFLAKQVLYGACMRSPHPLPPLSLPPAVAAPLYIFFLTVDEISNNTFCNKIKRA